MSNFSGGRDRTTKRKEADGELRRQRNSFKQYLQQIEEQLLEEEMLEDDDDIPMFFDDDSDDDDDDDDITD